MCHLQNISDFPIPPFQAEKKRSNCRQNNTVNHGHDKIIRELLPPVRGLYIHTEYSHSLTGLGMRNSRAGGSPPPPNIFNNLIPFCPATTEHRHQARCIRIFLSRLYRLAAPRPSQEKHFSLF